MVDILVRTMLWHPMFQVLDVFDGVAIELEVSKFHIT